MGYLVYSTDNFLKGQEKKNPTRISTPQSKDSFALVATETTATHPHPSPQPNKFLPTIHN